VGLLTVLALVAIVAVAAAQFQGRFNPGAPLTIIAERAGLVMNADAKVQLLGVQIGRVESIENRPDGLAALHLSIDPDQFSEIPDNVQINIAASTAFGAKFVQMVPPPNPSGRQLKPGQTLDTHHVTVEMNTMFDRLTSLLSRVDPIKLNRTLTAISSALAGRGRQLGTTLVALNDMLAKLEPSLSNLNHDLDIAPSVLTAYADASPDLLTILKSSVKISQTVVEKQHQLDELLISVIGLGDVGNEVLTDNGSQLGEAMRLLLPTTDLTNQYNEALTCTLSGLVEMQKAPPLSEPGVIMTVGFTWGRERYRFPQNLPKVAATGGPICNGLPRIPFGSSPPFVVADTGTDVTQTGQQGRLTLNADVLKRMLFGPSDGPPRNSAQIGQPG
jgi:virulence factor Mce-like protein